MARDNGGEKGRRFFGVYPASVLDVVDPEKLGRVLIRLPRSQDDLEAWARVATLMVGNNRGSWFVPDVGDEVLVIFEAGDPRCPYVIGALWNDRDRPPETMDTAGQNNLKMIRSRSGIRISLDDGDGQETLKLETPAGQTVTLKDGPGTIEVRDSNGNSAHMGPAGLTVKASNKITVNAGVIEVSAGILSVNAGVSKFSGVIQANTVITNSVVSSSYTPGAGNVW